MIVVYDGKSSTRKIQIAVPNKIIFHLHSAHTYPEQARPIAEDKETTGRGDDEMTKTISTYSYLLRHLTNHCSPLRNVHVLLKSSSFVASRSESALLSFIVKNS
jgi:hypothetical protein